MSALLDDIIKLAVDGNQPLPDLLRKCLLLGHELENERLKAWANQELNGYASPEGVPEYRIIPAIAKGHFVGRFRQLKHAIPSAALEPRHQDLAEKVCLVQSVNAYADSLRNRSGGDGCVALHWDPNVVLYYQNKLMPGCVLRSAWQEVPFSAIADVLDTVRNRTLNMALQIKDKLGTSYGGVGRIESKETESKIQSIVFQNTGGSTNVSFGNSMLDASGQVTLNVGDRQGLERALRSVGMDETDLAGLTKAMDADGTEPRARVWEWVKEKGTKVLVGGMKAGTQIGTAVLTAWIKQHYGITG